MAVLICTFGTVAFSGGLKTFDTFVVSSVSGLSALSTFVSTSSAEASFGIVAGSSAFYVGGMGFFGSAVEEVSPPNLGTTAGSI
jgi:hypothetical protein